MALHDQGYRELGVHARDGMARGIIRERTGTIAYLIVFHERRSL